MVWPSGRALLRTAALPGCARSGAGAGLPYLPAKPSLDRGPSPVATAAPRLLPGPCAHTQLLAVLGRWKVVRLRREPARQRLQKLQIKSAGGLQVPAACAPTQFRGLWGGTCSARSQQHPPQQRKHAWQQMTSKQNVVLPHTGALLSLEKEGGSDTCSTQHRP